MSATSIPEEQGSYQPLERNLNKNIDIISYLFVSIRMLDVRLSEIDDLETDELLFFPTGKALEQSGYLIYPKRQNGQPHEKLSGVSEELDTSSGFPAQTTIWREAEVISPILDFIQTKKPGLKKRILCGAGSIAAEGCGIAADLDHRGVLDQHEIVSTDASKPVTDHAKLFEFPKGMLYMKPAPICAAFKEKSEGSPWIVPHDHIREAVKVTDPTDLEGFIDEQGFDIIFLFNVLYHLTPEKQNAILLNMIAQCNSGIICFNHKDPNSQVGRETLKKVSKVFRNHGFVFADPSQANRIVPYRDKLKPLPTMSNACVAIHPDLAMEMVV